MLHRRCPCSCIGLSLIWWCNGWLYLLRYSTWTSPNIRFESVGLILCCISFVVEDFMLCRHRVSMQEAYHFGELLDLLPSTPWVPICLPYMLTKFVEAVCVCCCDVHFLSVLKSQDSWKSLHSLALMRDCSTKAGAIAGCTGAACESGFVVALCSIISFLAAASAVIPLRSCRRFFLDKLSNDLPYTGMWSTY